MKAQYILTVPINNTTRDKRIGALECINAFDESGHCLPFSETDCMNMARLVDIAGAAISNFKLSQDRQVAQTRIQSLLKMNRSVSMEMDADQVLERIVEVSYDLLNADRIAIFTKVPGEDLLYVSHARDVARGRYIPTTKGIAGRVATTGQLLSVSDAYSHPDFNASMDTQTGYRTKSILCAPVLDPEGTVLAVVEAINKKNGATFTSEDALFLTYVAEAAGISLHKSFLHQETLESKHLTEVRLLLAKAASSSNKIDSFLDICMEEGRKFLQVDRFGVLLVCNVKNELWLPRSIAGTDMRVPLGVGISGHVAETRESVCIKDACK